MLSTEWGNGQENRTLNPKPSGVRGFGYLARRGKRVWGDGYGHQYTWKFMGLSNYLQLGF